MVAIFLTPSWLLYGTIMVSVHVIVKGHSKMGALSALIPFASLIRYFAI
jgi:uncharacterized membrane protein